MQCVNNLKQIGLALANYESAHEVFPPAYVGDSEGRRLGFRDQLSRTGTSTRSPGFAWGTLILPYLEQSPALRQLQPQPALLGPGQHHRGPDEAVGVPLPVARPAAATGSPSISTRTAMRRPRTTAGPFSPADHASPTATTSPTPGSTSRGAGAPRTPTTSTSPSRSRACLPTSINGPFYRNSRHARGRRDRRAVEHGLRRRADPRRSPTTPGSASSRSRASGRSRAGRPTRTAAATWSAATAGPTSTTTRR